MYDCLEQIESVGSTSEKERLLAFMIRVWPDSDKFLRLAFNDLVYNLDKKVFYNAFEMYGGNKPDYSFADVSDWLYSLQLPADSDPTKDTTEEVIEDVLGLESFAKELLS